MKNHESRITNYGLFAVKILCVFCVLCGASFSNAQSTDQSFPTGVTTNEISGQIKARDIGDSRSTAYFYTFNAAQGDVFINVVTANFNGDIDVFTTEGLKTLTKIVVYADSPNNETGRVIYLRKPEKLLLRVEGRSPNDDAATFRIKFAGSFRAVAETEQSEQPKLPEVSAQNDSGIVVNSVGTIISVKPKPTPAPKEIIAEKEAVKNSEEAAAKIPVETATEKQIAAETPNSENEVVADNQPKNPESSEKLKVAVTDNLPETESEKEELVIEKAETKDKPAETVNSAATKIKRPKAKKPAQPNPLENVRLIVVFKDGTKIERPMSEVSRVNVDNKGMLTVVSKDGTIGRYSILEVAKFTIE